MNVQTREQPDYGFVIGLLTGTFVGAGLVTWFAPRRVRAWRRINDSATRLGERVSAQYRQAGARVGEAVDERREKARASLTLSPRQWRGAPPRVRLLATAVRSDGVAETRTAPRTRCQ